ncbi:LLM class flavin-dependent oxidoreductase [Pseudonocardia sp. RS010]|uniref:LLM class flavin-dependent oxidoreductase n=1 Tax=Pseudonocardia sp. RS010 TaxID=3385979 RepID=UPI00399FD4A3
METVRREGTSVPLHRPLGQRRPGGPGPLADHRHGSVPSAGDTPAHPYGGRRSSLPDPVQRQRRRAGTLDHRLRGPRAEAAGFDLLYTGDIRSTHREAWSTLTVMATVTSRITLGPGVTNPVTRHPAVTAATASSPRRAPARRGPG